MLPICYEESLPNGPADQCAEFMATATEMFVKDVVGSVYSLVRSNITAGGAKGGGVFTSTFKRSGDKKNSSSNLEMAQRPLSLGDLRVALSIADCSLGQMPDIVNDIMGGWPEGVLEGWDTYPEEQPNLDLHGSVEELSKINGAVTDGSMANGVRVNGVHTQYEPGIDQWPGSSSGDRNQLFGLLDDCLALGQ